MVEVLVATMGQTDLTLQERMNVQCDCLIANQSGTWGYQEKVTENGTVRMISTETKGVGINRNLGLQLAKADILLFADDDMTYYDGTLQGVQDAFQQFPDADVICFGIDMTRNGEVVEEHRCKNQRVHLWNSMRYGAVRIAVRRDAVIQNRLAFSTLFGGGCQYGSGEDSIFLRDCFRTGLKVYSHSYVLGTCAQDVSSWFSGYNEKFFFDKGAMLACAFKKTKHIIKWYYIWKFSKMTELPLSTVIKATNRGIRAFPKLGCFGDPT